MLCGTKYRISGDEDAGSMATTLGTLMVLDRYPAGKTLLHSKHPNNLGMSH